jgi:hypothetical protein
MARQPEAHGPPPPSSPRDLPVRTRSLAAPGLGKGLRLGSAVGVCTG